MKTLRIPLTILCVLAFSTLSVHAAQLASAKVLKVSGTVTKYDSSGSQAPLKAGEILTEGDSITATALSSAMLVFSNGSELTVEENTSLSLAKLEQSAFGGSQKYEQLQADPSQSQTLLELNYGKLSGHVKKLKPGSDFMVQTPLGTAAIRGTTFTTQLFYNAERGEFIFLVENIDGAVDVISRYFGGEAAAESSQSVPVGEQVVIRLQRGSPEFDSVFSLVENYIPTDPAPGLIPLPAPEFTPEDMGIIVVSPEDEAIVEESEELEYGETGEFGEFSEGSTDL